MPKSLPQPVNNLDERHPAGQRPAVSSAAVVIGLLLVLTVTAYLPSVRGSLLWDDDGHVTKPELQSLDGLRQIWFEIGATQQYYPLLHSAFWVEHRLWGDSVVGYHSVNVLLHAAAACLAANSWKAGSIMRFVALGRRTAP